MSRLFVILFSLLACALFGCESPNRPQTTNVSQPVEAPKIIPHIAASPARKPVIANSPNPIFDEYDSALIKAVQNQWDELLNKSEHRIGQKAGHVVVKCNLHADGSISDVAVVETVPGRDLTRLSQAAITESAPFGPWPDEMKRKVERDFRELAFTFRYY